MAFTVYVNNVDKSSYVSKNSLRITKRVGNQSNLDIAFNCRVTDWAPNLGQTIEVYDGATALFGGIIGRISRNEMEPDISSAAYTSVNINSNGYNNIAARRTINAYYTNQTAGFIFENIVDVVLNNASYFEGIIKGTFTAGQTFTKYSAVCKSVKDIFDDLAKQSGTQWYIDDERTIYFGDPVVSTADHTLDSSGTFTNYQIVGTDESMDNYCNKVFIKYSEGTYASVTDTSEITLRASADGTAWSSGVYGKIIQVGNVDNETALSTIGDNELKKYGFTPVSLKVRSDTSTWTVGAQIQIYQPKYGITSNQQFVIEELNISVQDNMPMYDMILSKCNSANISLQKPDKAKEFFEALISRTEIANTGGIDTGVTNIIDNYQVTTTADLSAISYTAGSTQVTATAFTTYSKSDIQMTFSAKIQVTAAITLTAVTYLQEGAVTSAMTHSPVRYMSSSQTFAYNEKFENVSSSSTVAITVKLHSDTGAWTISAGQTDMNIIVFPTQLTSNYSVSYITSQICTADRTLGQDNVAGWHGNALPCLAIDSATGKVFAAVKWISGSDQWSIYKSSNNGGTWTDISLPAATGTYSVGATWQGNASLAIANSILHVAYQSRYSANASQYAFISYNAYNIGADTWQYTNMLTISESCTYNLSTERFVRLIATASRVYLFHEKYNIYYSYYNTYSNDYFVTRSPHRALESNALYGKFALDTDGSSIHALYEVTAANITLRYANWSEAASAWSSSITVFKTTAATQVNFSKNICIDSASAVWCGAIFGGATPTYYLFKKTAGATAFNSGWGTGMTAYSCAMVLDNNDNPVIYFTTQNYGACLSKKFDVAASAFNTTQTSIIPFLAGDTWINNIVVKNYNNNLYTIYESGTSNATRKIAFHYNSNFE